jgi:hypothetical protein
LSGFEKEERGKKRRERERKGERREKRGKKGGEPNPNSERKIFFLNEANPNIFFLIFLIFFEMKLRMDLENPKSIIKK